MRGHLTAAIRLTKQNLKLVVYMFQMMKHCSKLYNIFYDNSTAVLAYQHLWGLEQKKMMSRYPKLARITECSPSLQVCERSERNSIGLCGLAAYQGGTYLA